MEKKSLVRPFFTDFLGFFGAMPTPLSHLARVYVAVIYVT
jgi:hypothetical protein